MLFRSESPKRFPSLPLALLALACLPAQAALYDPGQGMVYDDGLGITWSQDPNLFLTLMGLDS